MKRPKELVRWTVSWWAEGRERGWAAWRRKAVGRAERAWGARLRQPCEESLPGHVFSELDTRSDSDHVLVLPRMRLSVTYRLKLPWLGVARPALSLAPCPSHPPLSLVLPGQNVCPPPPPHRPAVPPSRGPNSSRPWTLPCPPQAQGVGVMM